jgi:DNA ligase (NAD+)
MNPACPARLLESLVHWASRDSLDIEGLGMKLADQLVSSGLVHDMADLYSLTAEELASLDRMGEKSAANLVAELDRSRSASLERFLTGLGIPGVGRVVASAIAMRFSDLDAVMNASEEDLSSVDGVGPVLAASVREFFSDRITRSMVQRLVAAGFSPESGGQSRGGSLNGLTVVFTGTLSLSRTEASRLAREAGATVTGSVSGRTDLVVAGEGAGGKLDRARSLGVRIVDENGFLDLLEEN